MNPPRSTDGRSHDHEDSQPEREEQRQSDPQAEEPLPSRDAPRGSAPGPEHPSVPATPAELVALQRPSGTCPPPEEPAAKSRVAQGLARLRAQELNPWECQQIALALLLQLENHHQAVVAEMQETTQSTTAQVACWAIDGDRLMHCRRLLESITLI